MPVKVHTSKVLCYIVRDDQLLVFRHADYDLEHVGIQVPAGSIRPGESPEDAALREAHEETGLSQFSVARWTTSAGTLSREPAWLAKAWSRWSGWLTGSSRSSGKPRADSAGSRPGGSEDRSNRMSHTDSEAPRYPPRSPCQSSSFTPGVTPLLTSCRADAYAKESRVTHPDEVRR